MANQIKPVRMYWKGPGAADLANNARKFLNYVDSLNPFPDNQILNEAFKNAMGNRRIVRPDGSIVHLQRGPINSVRVDAPITVTGKEKRRPTEANYRFVAMDVYGVEDDSEGTVLFPINDINGAAIFIPKRFSAYYQRCDGFPGYPDSLAGLTHYPEILESGAYKVQELIGKLVTSSLVQRDNSGNTEVVTSWDGSEYGLSNSSGAKWVRTYPNFIKNGTTQLNATRQYVYTLKKAYEVNGTAYADKTKYQCKLYNQPTPPPGWLEEYCVNSHGFRVWAKMGGQSGYYLEFFKEAGGESLEGTWANVTTTYGHVSSAHHAWGFMEIQQSRGSWAMFDNWAIEYFLATGTDYHAALAPQYVSLGFPGSLTVYTGLADYHATQTLVKKPESIYDTTSYQHYLRYNGSNILIRSGDANKEFAGIGGYNFHFDDTLGYEYYTFFAYCDDENYDPIPTAYKLGLINNGSLSYRTFPFKMVTYSGGQGPYNEPILYTLRPGQENEVNYIAYSYVRIVDVLEGIPVPRTVEG